MPTWQPVKTAKPNVRTTQRKLVAVLNWVNVHAVLQERTVVHRVKIHGVVRLSYNVGNKVASVCPSAVMVRLYVIIQTENGAAVQIRGAAVAKKTKIVAVTDSLAGVVNSTRNVGPNRVNA